MNNVGKYVRCLRKINLLSSSIPKHKHIPILQEYEFSTRISPLIYFSSCIKSIRHASKNYQIGLPDAAVTNDVLLTSIINSKSSSEVLQMIRLHNSVMTAPQHLQALNSLFTLQKSKSSKISKEELTRSPEFKALCQKLQKYSRNFELKEVMNCVKCLSFLGVSVNSNIMQMMLQLISKMINDMTLHQITFLHFLLKDLSSCPLVDALKLALPIVFETQVRFKIENNVYWQIELLNYITKHNLSQQTYDLVMSKVIKHLDQLNHKVIKNVLLYLYYKGYSTDKYIETINKCLEIYANNLEITTNVLEIEAILTRMIFKYLFESEVFYNEQFINKVIEFLIKSEKKFEDLGYILKKLNKIGYVNRGLLDHMTIYLVDDPTALESIKLSLLLGYIAGCANANYVPPGFNELQPNILKRLDKHKDIVELPWLLITFDLAVLNCWSEDLLERVFSRDFLYGFLKRSGNTHDYVMLLKLYQATVTIFPGGYRRTLPPTDIIEKAINIYHPNIPDTSLKTSLEHGLGGDDYVLTGVRSKLGHFIDHLVVMRPGGYSVAIKKEFRGNNSKLFLEDIVNSNENLVIGIVLYKSNNHIINLNNLRGPYELTNKTIEALGIAVLPISMDVWNGLLDYEKIPYIMRELKSKTDSNMLTENNISH